MTMSPPYDPAAAAPLAHALRLEGNLDGTPSRGLWLVKWFLLIPHYILLGFLSILAFVATVIALVAIVATGRYPRAIFDFNLGVLRWWWRVGFYGYSALGTDRYPPLTLGLAPDYPATLDLPYPEHLSRGLALVKWWLLALPHYVIIALFLGGSTLWHHGSASNASYPGLIDVLAVVAGVALLFTARYPRGLFDLLMGLNRWVFRVAAYAMLLTDEYPPFRLDLGAVEKG